MDIRAKIAKEVAEQYVRKGVVPAVERHLLPQDLWRQQACYVYLYQKPGRRLRAMYGNPLPRQASLADEIAVNTVQAIESYGSKSIRRPDLSSLVYSVAALGPLQRISQVGQLNPAVFGLYAVSDTGKFQVMLPGRTGVETAQDQYATVLRESGINDKDEIVSLYKFTVSFYE